MIGVFDSGSGGLTILNALRKNFPSQDFIYLGDHARAPYGHRSNERIVNYTAQACDFLMGKGCDLVILACNTAAAIGGRTLQQNWLPLNYPDNRVLGVLVPMVEAVTGVPWHHETPQEDGPKKHIGLFATKKTVESGSYHREVMKRAPDITLTQHACPGLVDAIEGGAGLKPLTGLIGGYVEEMREMAGCTPDAVVLGCTHFPLVEDCFRLFLGEDIPIYSQPTIVSESLANYLERHSKFRQPGSGKVDLFTTGLEGKRETLAKFLPDDLTTFKSIKL
ncbi:glutamate racemase [Temperatibacter marinus]|uniref:Glutamate racemase n=1 Tax=Temperatibacter marinus TaxID=1456591 RepID=A0AA52EDE0_9PROT|nr:glutamate racemase [Temperatibacter marinus]WND02640.1 glutamate racemase [Temperatibacter marinus]